MFQVSTIEDKAVRIQPSNLALTQLEAITQQIEATYVDKVRASEGAGRACKRCHAAALCGGCCRGAARWRCDAAPHAGGRCVAVARTLARLLLRGARLTLRHHAHLPSSFAALSCARAARLCLSSVCA
jgi:sulfatase maturation enzyme AslB (radical SAM superfamily)